MAAFHSFSTAAAREVGVTAAVLLHYIAYWCETNEANRRNFKDGRYWTYNSYTALERLFPYLTYKQIRTALGVLEKRGLIITAAYNDKAFDKTKWYSVTDDGLALDCYGVDGGDSLPQRAEAVCPAGQSPSAPEGRPIPVNNILQLETEDIYSPSAQEGRGSELVSEVIAHLNSVCGTGYRASTKSTRGLIVARAKEGFTLDDFKRVIDTKAAQWLHDPNMCKYLRPSTLFGTKFESYLNEPSPTPKDDYSQYSFRRRSEC